MGRVLKQVRSGNRKQTYIFCPYNKIYTCSWFAGNTNKSFKYYMTACSSYIIHYKGVDRYVRYLACMPPPLVSLPQFFSSIPFFYTFFFVIPLPTPAPSPPPPHTSPFPLTLSVPSYMNRTKLKFVFGCS